MKTKRMTEGQRQQEGMMTRIERNEDCGRKEEREMRGAG